MEILGYLGAISAGLSLGLIGGGGSILILPILIYFFDITPALSTTYSLFIVGFASTIGAYQYHKSREINYKVGILFLLPSVIGVLVSRRFILPTLPERIFQIGNLAVGKSFLILVVFTALMLAASITMILRQRRNPLPQKEVDTTIFSHGEFASKSLMIGSLTGFVGAGGGFLIIPALVVLGRLPMKVAIGTSLFIISINSFVGFAGDSSLFYMLDWVLLVSVAAATSLGILFGKRMSKLIPSQSLEPVFGWFVLIVGIYIFVKQASVAFA